MTPGDTIRYHQDVHATSRYYHRVGTYVRTIAKGKYKGWLEISHGGKYAASTVARIKPEQVIERSNP